MIPVVRTYSFDTSRTLRYFAGHEHFLRKLRKHFLNPSEPWGRLFQVSFLRQLGQKLRANDVSLVEDAYQQAVEIIDAGVRFSAALPLYVRIREHVPEAPERERGVYYFLAEAGFKIVAYGGMIRTAYFMSKNPQESKYTLFKDAWFSLRARALAPKLTNSPNGVRLEYPEVDWFNRENWMTCPNPHPAPRRGRRERPLPAGIDEWLAEVAAPRKESSRDHV